jgi:hypothetical protein
VSVRQPPAEIISWVHSVSPEAWSFFTRSFYGLPSALRIEFRSWFRNPRHNAEVKGHPRSQHLVGTALDWRGPDQRVLADHLRRLGWTVLDEGDHHHAQVWPAGTLEIPAWIYTIR